ncbi:b(0,+)-type amino acid transporter 1-like [Myotis daubentonii]|uniref:b(0,+)-type amino acid transporter 1-like n=1 Tax=Myotis daubentonii TaxID=98922 RepID=UPI002872AE7A|nr:b(0,+)-type amino acid transporter 1-like [Myotis daubentonii]
MERSQERDGGEGVAGQEPGAGRLRLRREIGLWSGVSLIVGSMVGSGIFMSPQGILVYMGSPGASLVVWAVCGLLATLSALCFAELGALVPESGGEYAYILHTFGSLPAFLVIYTFVLVSRPASIAAISLSFAEYAVAPFYPGCSSLPPAVLKSMAVACILLLLLVNGWSTKLATQLNDVCTAAKVFSLLVIVAGGAAVLGQGRGRPEALPAAFHNTTRQTGRISVAFYQGLWSFDGWNTLNYVLEELKNPQDRAGQDRGLDTMKQMCLLGLCRHLLLEFRKGDHYEAEQPRHLPVCVSMRWVSELMEEGHMACVAPGPGTGPAAGMSSVLCSGAWEGPHGLTYGLLSPTVQQNLVWALMIAIPLVTGLYILVNISYLLVLSPNEILSTDAVAVSWGNQVLGAWAWLVPLAVALSTFGSAHGTFFSGSRVCYVAAREGHMPGLLSMVHTRRLTPTPALVFTTAVTLVLVLSGNFSNIVNSFRQLPCLGHLRNYHQLSPVLADEEEEPTPTLQGEVSYPGRDWRGGAGGRWKQQEGRQEAQSPGTTYRLPRTSHHPGLCPLQVPTIVPIVALLASLYLVLAPIIDHPQIEFLYIFLLLLSGFPVYFLFVYFQHHPKCLQTATLHLQLLLEVAPATKNVD